MRPGTPHFVVSGEDCLAVGGHYYCSYLLRRTIHAMVIEQLIGHLVTNTGHSSCGIVFLKMLSYVKLLFERIAAWDQKGLKMDKSRGHGSLWIPSASEVANLIVLVCYLDQLGPSEIPESIEKSDLGKKKKSEDEVARDFFYPKGDLVTYDKDNNFITVNSRKVPDIWQKSAAGRKDMYHTVSVILKRFLFGFQVSEYLLSKIITAERFLLGWSKEAYDQLSAKAEHGCQPHPPRRINKSPALSYFIEKLNARLEKPLDLEWTPPELPGGIMTYFKELETPEQMGTKRKAAGDGKPVKRQRK